MNRCLEKVRIIELCDEMWGSMGLAYLADFGAEVIKLEPPEGHPDRYETADTGEPSAGWNYYFEVINRGKKSFAVDIDKEEGKGLIYDLIKKSDVFATNIPREVLEKKRMDYEGLRQINPGIIYAVGSGFGRHGTDTHLPGVDGLAAARAGLMPTLPQPGNPPIYPAIGESITAMIMAYGIMLALYHQKRAGEGQEVDVSLFGSNIYFEHCYLQAYLGTYYRDKVPTQVGMSSLLGSLSRKEQGNPLLNYYKTKDGWIYLGLHQSDLYWHNFCKGVGIERLENDPQFATHSLRGKHNKELIAILDEILVSKTTSEWLKQWEGLGLIVDVICDFSEVEKDPQVLENRFIIDFDHPSYGLIKMLGFPIILVDTPASINNLAPGLGQHTKQILIDVLGYTQDDFVELKKRRIIA